MSDNTQNSDKFRVGVDIGGTFTDIVFIDGKGNMFTNKVLSTYPDFSKAIVRGTNEVFEKAGINGGSVSQLVHGCTIATNTILERSAEPTGLITTKGFRDILEIRRSRMPEQYNLHWEKPVPLAPRENRMEVEGRIDARGNEIIPLNTVQVEEATGKLKAMGVKSIAVCLINSYVNPVHEQEVKEIIGQKYPELWVTTSSDLIPLMREYERSSEVCVNAYIRPVVVEYLSSLTDKIRSIGVEAPLLLMKSDGGMMSFEAGAEQPINIIECGPAAGVIGASYLAKKLDMPNILTLDMGGTTTKAAVIENYEVAKAANYEVGAGISMSSLLSSGGGYVIRVASIDIAEIGAGGGSKIRIDAGGALKIGPESTGSQPGPACYDLGGEDPALTDANILLGYLNPDHLAGGTVKLDASKAKTAVDKISDTLDWKTTKTAYGAHIIGNSNMIRAIRAVTTERGRDPRDFTLFAFGGAGPIHAASLAKEMDIKKIVIVPTAGLFSAFGLLFSEIEHTRVKSFQHRLDEESTIELANDVYAELEKKVLEEIETGGYGDVHVVIERSADLKYIGEASETTINVPWDKLNAEHASILENEFHEEHLKTYAHKRESEPIVMAILRVRAKVYMPETVSVEDIKPPIQEIERKTRKAYFGETHGWMDTDVIGIKEVPDEPVQGPVVIEFFDSTCVVPPYCKYHLGAWGTVNIEITDQGGLK